MSLHFTPAATAQAAPSITSRGLAQVPSLIFDRKHLPALVKATSLSALSWNRGAAFAGMQPIILTDAGTVETPDASVKLGAAGQLLIGRGVFEVLRTEVRHDPQAIQQTPCQFQRGDHLLIVQQTWDLRIGGLFSMLSPFVLAGKSPSAEALALLCERYDVPVMVWVADDADVEFVRTFNAPGDNAAMVGHVPAGGNGAEGCAYVG